MNSFPEGLENLLLSYIKKTYGSKKKSKRSSASSFQERDFLYFAKGAYELSCSFTQERGRLPKNYLNSPVLRSGYLLYFLPVNLLKVVRILDQFRPLELASGELNILDIGSGPGTSMLGLMHYYSQQIQRKNLPASQLYFTLVDQNLSVLKEAAYFHQQYNTALKKIRGFDSQCVTHQVDIDHSSFSKLMKGKKYQFIILSNFLNELPSRDHQVQFVSHLMNEYLDPHKGKLIIIEPALRKASRDLQFLRDEIVVRRKMGFVHAPCLHACDCPLNVANQRDWCHFYFSWDTPKFIEKVDRLIGNKKSWLALSYLVLSCQNRGWKDLLKNPKNSWRVISNLMHFKGKKEVVLCGPLGRFHLIRLDRFRSQQNKDVDFIRRGDLIEVNVKDQQYCVDGKYEACYEDRVKIIS